MVKNLDTEIDGLLSLVERSTEAAAQLPPEPQPVERSTKPESTQPRLKKNAPLGWGLLHSYDLTAARIPAYSSQSMARDSQLRNIWRMEPHLAGIVNAVVLIDSNRGWSLTGGRNQVNRFTAMLHSTDGRQGWRSLARKNSLSYWTTDLGVINELGREGKGGPIRNIYHVDSARCQLRPDGSLQYFPALGDMQTWTADDYFRICSMPSDDEAFGGLGFSAISRSIEITRILYAVMIHDQEQIGARAPRGLLLLSNITEQQWEQSLATREEKMDSLEYRYYSGVQVLASSGMGNPDAKLVALSQLPTNFDAKTFYDLSMYAYANCFGFDPSEFWPVQFGALGRGTETEVQHQKATGKGGTEFALSYQEQLQNVLPDTLHFEFEQRDDQGEITQASVNAAKSAWISNLYQSGLQAGAPVISRDEARQLMVDAGLIPSEWTLTPDEATATDTEDAETPDTATAQAQRLLDTVPVRRAIAQFPYEPIVRVSWPGKRMQVLYDPLRRKRTFAKGKKRADTPKVLFQGSDFSITQADVDRAVEKARRLVGDEYASLLVAPTIEGK
jgi:hypothetical protein